MLGRWRKNNWPRWGKMKLIIGLGNPGDKYKKSRHNLGFMVVDELARKLTKGEVKWEQDRRSNSLVFKQYPNRLILVKPQTFMNGSGQAVAKIIRYYGGENKTRNDLWVVHDDVDIQLGKLKIRMGGAAAGHHGVESIIEQLGTDKFLRFRLGIGHPRERRDSEGYKDGGVKMDVETFVIREFDINEKTELKHLIKQTVQAIEVALKDGPEKAMNRFNR